MGRAGLPRHCTGTYSVVTTKLINFSKVGREEKEAACHQVFRPRHRLTGDSLTTADRGTVRLARDASQQLSSREHVERLPP